MENPLASWIPWVYHPPVTLSLPNEGSGSICKLYMFSLHYIVWSSCSVPAAFSSSRLKCWLSTSDFFSTCSPKTLFSRSCTLDYILENNNDRGDGHCESGHVGMLWGAAEPEQLQELCSTLPAAEWMCRQHSALCWFVTATSILKNVFSCLLNFFFNIFF